MKSLLMIKLAAAATLLSSFAFAAPTTTPRAPNGRFVATAYTLTTPTRTLHVMGGQAIRPGSHQAFGGTLRRIGGDGSPTFHAVPATAMHTASGALVKQPVQLERRGHFFTFTPSASAPLTRPANPQPNWRTK